MNYLNFLLAQSKALQYFTFDTIRGRATTISLILLGVFIVAGLIVYFVKKDSMKYFWYTAGAATLIYSLVILIRFAVIDFGDEDRAKYQNFLLIFAILAAVIIVGIVVAIRIINKKQDLKNSKALKIFSIASVVVFSIASLILFILSVKKAGGVAANTDVWQMDSNTGVLVGASLFVLIVGIAILQTIASGNKKSAMDTKMLAQGALCIALSFALSYIRLFKLPQGGSITLASVVPIAIFAYMYGPKKGLMITLVYGLLQAVQDPWIVHPIQFLLDYPIAFSMFGLAGIFAGIKRMPMQVKFGLGLFTAALLRFVSHIISGVVYFGHYAAEGQSKWAYSVGYNSFIFGDIAIALVVAALLLSSKQIQNILNTNIRRLEKETEEDAGQLANPTLVK